LRIKYTHSIGFETLPAFTIKVQRCTNARHIYLIIRHLREQRHHNQDNTDKTNDDKDSNVTCVTKTLLLSLYVEMTEHSFMLENAYYRQRARISAHEFVGLQWIKSTDFDCCDTWRAKFKTFFGTRGANENRIDNYRIRKILTRPSIITVLDVNLQFLH